MFHNLISNLILGLHNIYILFDLLLLIIKLLFSVRENLRATKKEYAKTEDDLKSLQSVGQIIGEVLRPLDNERCKYPLS